MFESMLVQYFIYNVVINLISEPDHYCLWKYLNTALQERGYIFLLLTTGKERNQI